MKTYESEHFIAIPPGETIKEVLEHRHMTQKELAIRMKMSEKHISKLINGEVPLTQDVAYRLELVLGVEASFWNGLESRFREKLIKVNYENSLQDEINFAKPFGYAKLARLGIVPESDKEIDQVSNLQKFFEVVSLQTLFQNGLMSAAQCGDHNANEAVLYTLFQVAKREARNIDSNPFNMDLLATFIPRISDLAMHPIDDIRESLRDMLAVCGIAIVYLPIVDKPIGRCITFTEGKRLVLGIQIQELATFWDLLMNELETISSMTYSHKGGKLTIVSSKQPTITA